MKELVGQPSCVFTANKLPFFKTEVRRVKQMPTSAQSANDTKHKIFQKVHHLQSGLANPMHSW